MSLVISDWPGLSHVITQDPIAVAGAVTYQTDTCHGWGQGGRHQGGADGQRGTNSQGKTDTRQRRGKRCCGEVCSISRHKCTEPTPKKRYRGSPPRERVSNILSHKAK